MTPDLKSISKAMKKHHSRKFDKFGATARGADWSKKEDVQLRYEKMLAYCLSELSSKVRLDHSYGLYEFTLYIYKKAVDDE